MKFYLTTVKERKEQIIFSEKEKENHIYYKHIFFLKKLKFQNSLKFPAKPICGLRGFHPFTQIAFLKSNPPLSSVSRVHCSPCLSSHIAESRLWGGVPPGISSQWVMMIVAILVSQNGFLCPKDSLSSYFLIPVTVHLLTVPIVEPSLQCCVSGATQHIDTSHHCLVLSV